MRAYPEEGKLTRHNIKDIYKRNRVTLQQVQQRPAPPKPKPEQQQREDIAALQMEVSGLRSRGYEVVQYDQCVFSVNQYHKRQWAPSGSPLQVQGKWAPSQLVVVCGFISAESGNVLMHAEEKKSFSGQDMAELFKKVQRKLGNRKLALFGDNASINKSANAKQVAAACTRRRLPTELVYNLPYRPDLSKYPRFASTTPVSYTHLTLPTN